MRPTEKHFGMEMSIGQYPRFNDYFTLDSLLLLKMGLERIRKIFNRTSAPAQIGKRAPKREKNV
jgi:hypothetical protein